MEKKYSNFILRIVDIQCLAHKTMILSEMENVCNGNMYINCLIYQNFKSFTLTFTSFFCLFLHRPGNYFFCFIFIMSLYISYVLHVHFCVVNINSKAQKPCIVTVHCKINTRKYLLIQFLN